ncbi:hypothetical protein OH77DRAFT_1056980 [Trametes cingulata]|nr:hypothetical protein OH77DRAFT_1056980 [Trametes cingulata]
MKLTIATGSREEHKPTLVERTFYVQGCSCVPRPSSSGPCTVYASAISRASPASMMSIALPYCLLPRICRFAVVCTAQNGVGDLGRVETVYQNSYDRVLLASWRFRKLYTGMFLRGSSGNGTILSQRSAVEHRDATFSLFARLSRRRHLI